MRMQHWSKWVMALLVNAACVASAPAQDYPFDVAPEANIYQTAAGGETAQGQPGAPMESGFFTGYSNAHGAYPVQPWPDVSPYDHSFDQTYYDNGLWYRKTNNRQTRRYFGIDYFNAKLKRPKSGQPGGVVGSTIVNENNVYEWTVREILGQLQFAPLKDITEPFYTEEFGSDEARPSLRAQYGAVNADGSGWEIAGFLAPGDEQTVSLGPAAINRTPDLEASNREGPVDRLFFDDQGELIFVLASIFPDLGRLPFDQGVIMTFDSKAWGGDINYYTTPIGETSGVSNFQSSFGLRYLGIWEDFGFQGSDSGFEDRITFLPDGRAYQISPFTTRVQSKLMSNLVGPQVGLKWALGGDTLKLVTEAKGSITVNFEENELRYNNYGLEPNNDSNSFDFSPFGFFAQSELRPSDPRDGREKKVNVDFAPVFEVSIMAELGIMQHAPLLKKLPGFRNSKFRFGYSYTQAWRIRRAAQAIDYRAPFPVLNTDRESWHVGGWTAGFVWKH